MRSLRSKHARRRQYRRPNTLRLARRRVEVHRHHYRRFAGVKATAVKRPHRLTGRTRHLARRAPGTRHGHGAVHRAHSALHHARRRGYHVHRRRGYHIRRRHGYHQHRRHGLRHPHKGFHGHRHRHRGYHIHRRRGLHHPHKGFHGHRKFKHHHGWTHHGWKHPHRGWVHKKKTQQPPAQPVISAASYLSMF